MESTLGTTNIILGIMAAVSVLEGLVVLGIAVGGFMIYRRVMQVVADIESRQVAPVMGRVNAILDDVKNVSERVKDEAGRVDDAIRNTMGRVDDTADRMRSNVRAKTSWVVGVVRGARAAIETMLQSRAA